jgi:glucokinase
VDLGATNIRLALVEARGEVLTETRFPVGGKREPRDVAARIAGGVGEVLRDGGADLRDISGVGVGCAGQISADGRRVLFAPNLGWRDAPLADLLEEALKRPVTLENDVRAAALGEAALGAGQGIRDLVCIFVGTGVGSGILIGGKLLRGSRNLAGEVGHMKLDPSGPSCSCGGHGCLEVYAGGNHVSRRVREALERGAASTLSQAKELHVKAVEEAARNGDLLARRFWDEMVWALGLGVSNLVTLLNPQRVILGGGVIEATPVLVARVREAVSQWATMLSGAEVELVRASLGGRAGAIGASRLVGEEASGVACRCDVGS